VTGLYVLAAPILDSDGAPLAAISVAAPAIQTALRDFEAAGAEPIMQAARTLSRALQASGGFVHRQSA
jgi:IclR family pca regulon transcriptional regulator